MTWLAIDTATDVASVAVGSTGSATHVVVEAGARRHAAQLVPMIARALWQAGASAHALERIVVGDGPGSFTGLRIAWAAARGLAHERGLPIVAVPALAGLAAQAARAQALGGEPVAACFDALRGQVFAAVYRFAEGGAEALLPPQLTTVDALAAGGPPAALAVGDGADRYADAVTRWTGRAPLATWRDPAHVVIAAGLAALADAPGIARPIDDPHTAEPEYGRPAEAQARWEAEHGRPLPRSTG